MPRMRGNCDTDHITKLLKGEIKIQLNGHGNFFTQEELLKERIIAYIAECMIEFTHVDLNPGGVNKYSLISKKNGQRKISGSFMARLKDQGNIITEANTIINTIKSEQNAKKWPGDSYEEICEQIVKAVEELFTSELEPSSI